MLGRYEVDIEYRYVEVKRGSRGGVRGKLFGTRPRHLKPMRDDREWWKSQN